MILEKKNLTERIHKESLLEKIRSEKQNLDLLLRWSLLNEQPLGWRSTWLLRQIIKKKDPIIQPHVSTVLELFSSFNESQKREWLKTLENQIINEDEEGILFDLCISEWKNVHNHPALRASAINMIFELLKKYPELKSELNHLMTTEYIASLSPGIQRSVLKTWNRQ